MIPCPDCLSEIPAEATFCRHCGERITGQPCPDCGSRAPEDARVCRWCGHGFASDGAAGAGLVDFEPFQVEAEPLPTFLVRGRLRRQTMVLTREKILVRTPGLFNLSVREEEIPWAKVAGFDYHSGILWDRVRIETRGQSSTDFPCLAKEDGERIRAVLRQLEI